jgi:tRNA (cmo5U34)-methyltransferase
MRDEVYRSRYGDLIDFTFDATVAAVFPDMIRRSVPGYDTVVQLTGLIAAHCAAPGTVCYDLGCSLGATARSMERALADKPCRIVAVDDSAAMLARARDLGAGSRIEWLEGDLRHVPIVNAGAVAMNWTLQFVPPDDRLPLLERIRAALHPAGVLIVSEKVRESASGIADLEERLHTEFKLANGYSELEVAQKRAALERVLIPDTPERHAERFAAAGFQRVHTWFRCLNWMSWLAFPK